MKINTILCASILMLVSVQANAAFIPVGLNPGDTYQLAFVTSTRRDATSFDIDDYNDFVQAAADTAALGGVWKAIASTPFVDARDNAVVDITSNGVFNMGGEQVASGFGDMWDGDLSNPISYDEYGVNTISEVWTGSTSSGFGDPGLELGSLAGFSDNMTSGLSTVSGSDWVQRVNQDGFQQLTLYGLSEVLTVTAVPEPAVIWLFGTGLLGLIGFSKRRKSQ